MLLKGFLTPTIAYVSLQRIETFLREEEVPEWASTLSTSRRSTENDTDQIGFRKAVFAWSAKTDEDDRTPRFVLGPLDIEFPSGQLTLVTGSTASGKSALLGALLGGMCLVRLLEALSNCVKKSCIALWAQFRSINLDIRSLTVLRIPVRVFTVADLPWSHQYVKGLSMLRYEITLSSARREGLTKIGTTSLLKLAHYPEISKCLTPAI